jgi:hypothetical protein
LLLQVAVRVRQVLVAVVVQVVIKLAHQLLLQMQLIA